MINDPKTGSDLMNNHCATVDDMPGKLRSLACVHPIIAFGLTPDFTLKLARRIEDGGKYPEAVARTAAGDARHAHDRTLIDAALASIKEARAAGEVVWAGIDRLRREMAMVTVSSFAAGFVVAFLINLAGWL